MTVPVSVIQKERRVAFFSPSRREVITNAVAGIKKAAEMPISRIVMVKFNNPNPGFPYLKKLVNYDCSSLIIAGLGDFEIK
jgi:hypothetical protein